MNEAITEKVEAEYSKPWIGKDGRQYRKAYYWNGRGWQAFLQVFEDGVWRGI